MARPAGYSRLQIALHWLVVLLVLAEYATGELAEDGVRGGLAALHVWPGIAIIGLMALRLMLRLVRGVPAPPESEAPILHRIAEWTHRLFYALLLAIPAGGLWSLYFGGRAGQLIHDLAEPVFFVLVWLHVAAALYHRVVLKSGVMERMLKPQP